MNLATLMVESGKRVLLIDVDLRRGHLAERLGLPAGSGMLADQLAHADEQRDLARATSVPNLFLLNAAKHLRNPSSVLSAERFRSLMETYEKDYDLIIDTPPLLAVPDAAVIASAAGAALLVVRAASIRAKSSISRWASCVARRPIWSAWCSTVPRAS
ncbi:Tyrosine-protein kinase Wzc [Candidatus Paraburkholderia calva]|nr:Tyrosine-protein kinase Wzc [Candidatus Paraburkholderia calva]